MRVLVNALSARKGGILTYTRNLLGAFRERGIDITIAAPDEFSTDAMSRVERININQFSPLHRFVWEQFLWRRIVLRHSPDVLFSSANFGLLNCPVKQVLLLREGGLFDPYYLANMAPSQGLENAVTRYFRRKIMLMSARAADHIITPTEAMRNMVSLWNPEIASKSSVNPYGTINDTFRPSSQPRKWRENGVLKLLYVSVYYPHKVPGLICQALNQLNSMGVKAMATITMSLDELESIKGGGLDKTIINEAHRRKLVTLGRYHYRDLPALYRGHDVFVFPSVSETFGHPMAEAMSSGLPVVAADTPVNREICGQKSAYFKPFMVSELVDQLLRLDGDSNTRELMAKFGRARAIDLYNWDSHVDRLVDTFTTVAAS
ncbi:MAG: glycosyltransferase family 1 protein [Pseudomonadota bacterium]|nr:glycosyltransferase family 1 protein [Pseudomonadota bacterium]